MKGTARGEPVAIKIALANDFLIKDFKNEIASLLKVQNSRRVLQIKGVCIEPVNEGLKVITEYCANGNMKNAIRSK